MILGLMGDCHLTNKAPERRIDGYWETQKGKFIQALDIFKSNGCDCIIQTGDLIDNPDVSNIVKSFIIDTLKRYNIKLNMVFGQHSIYGHSKDTLPSSTLSVLKSAGVINLLSDKYDWQNSDRQSRIKRGTELLGIKNVGEVQHIMLYGAGFGESIPIPENEDDYNILVIHAMIGDRPLYPGQELKNPQHFLKKYPKYNLVVCGDYHYRFIETYEGRIILNPGALVRKTISEFDLELKPAVVVFDTETNKSRIVELDVKPIEEVFDLSITKKKDNDALNRFINGLKDENKAQVGWKSILIKVLKDKLASNGAKKVIDMALEELKNGKS